MRPHTSLPAWLAVLATFLFLALAFLAALQAPAERNVGTQVIEQRPAFVQSVEVGKGDRLSIVPPDTILHFQDVDLAVVLGGSGEAYARRVTSQAFDTWNVEDARHSWTNDAAGGRFDVVWILQSQDAQERQRFVASSSEFTSQMSSGAPQGSLYVHDRAWEATGLVAIWGSGIAACAGLVLAVMGFFVRTPETLPQGRAESDLVAVAQAAQEFLGSLRVATGGVGVLLLFAGCATVGAELVALQWGVMDAPAWQRLAVPITILLVFLALGLWLMQFLRIQRLQNRWAALAPPEV